MVQGKIIEYAKKQIEITASENGIQNVTMTENSIVIGMISGKNYELSQKEIEYQAQEFLESEIQDLKN
jgi:hypothetical protein|tara:strand:+ start:1990 stop:2193 length:204 start_codon:yes stop_codon:yes gene_type:complete